MEKKNMKEKPVPERLKIKLVWLVMESSGLTWRGVVVIACAFMILLLLFKF